MGLLTRKEAEPEDPPREATQPRKTKAFRIELGWRGMFGLVVVCFFLFFWMFVLGIWAGQTILLPSRDSRVTQPGESPRNNLRRGQPPRAIRRRNLSRPRTGNNEQ